MIFALWRGGRGHLKIKIVALTKVVGDCFKTSPDDRVGYHIAGDQWCTDVSCDCELY